MPSNGNGDRPRAELDALHETTVLVAERHDTPRLLRLILERAAMLVGVEHAYVYLFDADRRRLTINAGTGVFASRIGSELKPGEGVTGRVASTGEPLAVDDYPAWPERTRDPETAGCHALVCAPLRGGDGVLGVIGLARTAREGPFNAEEVGLLDRFSRLAAMALDNARLHEHAQVELTERRRTEEDLLDAVSRLSRSESDLRQAQAETIRRLADAAEFRDAETGRHTERMARMCEQIARRLGLDEERCTLLRDASPLHDIGKIAIPDDVLLKPGAFDADERDVMERHAEIGHRLLSGSTSEVLDLAATIALTHHERWDGGGYPNGLAGEEIPLEGRIASVADVFDALTTDRVYREALTVEVALGMMRDQRGGQFDPFVFDVLEDLVHREDVEEALSDLDVSVVPDDPEEAAEEVLVPGNGSRGPRSRSGPLSDRAWRRACQAAERQVEAGGGRHGIEEALAQLCGPFDGALLASVYEVGHDRLWLVAQRGYVEVRDGFAMDHGVMGRAARTGTIQVVDDVTADPDFVPATGGITAEVAVPIHADGRIVGVVNVECLGRQLPRSAGAALAPLAARLAARIDEIRGGFGSDVGELVRLCVHASSLRGVGAIAELATRTVGRILGLSSAQLDLWRADDTEPRLVSFWRRHDADLEPLAEKHLRQLERTLDAQATSSVVAARQIGLGEPGTDALAVLPLRVGGATVGLLAGRLAGATPSQEQIEAATLFTQHTAALIDVASALRREQRAAVTDQLTGLLNRRGFEERFQDELQRAARDDSSVSIVLCDCDGLKTMNDLRGHEIGDQLLELIASCLRTHKRATDVAARFGGDEFALLLPDADIETALAVTERIREAITTETIAGFRPSASFGAASFPLHGRTTVELLKVADDALYRAKQRGGDEIVTFAA